MDLEIVLKVIAIMTGVYEVLARILPTVNDWSVLGNIIKILKAISDALNRFNKEK